MKYIKFFEAYKSAFSEVESSIGEENHGVLIETGERFWIGSVNILDGVIEEVHTYEEAADWDFHHSMYFSVPQCEKMKDGECMIFWLDSDPHKPGIQIHGEWTSGKIPYRIIEKIKEQIKII